MKWRFENTGHRAGVFNMEYDEALAHALVNDNSQPTIRVYRLEPARNFARLESIDGRN